MTTRATFAVLALSGCGGSDFGGGGSPCETELGGETSLHLADGETYCYEGTVYGCDDGTIVTTSDDPTCTGGGDSDVDTDADTDTDTGTDTGSDTGPDVPAGCERTAIESACTGAPGISERRDIDVGGETRTYNLYVPASAGCSTPSGILFFFHGLGGNENNFDALSPYMEDADLLFVQPRGFPQSWAGGALGWVPDGFDENVDFVRAVRDLLESEYEVDPYRVWIAGFSQGAFMTAALASPDAMGEEVTGAGIFGGGEEGNTCFESACYAGLDCKIPFFMRTGDADVHLEFTQAIYDALVAEGWPDAQLDFETFPGGHTIRPDDVARMIEWLDGAYPRK